MIPPQKNGEFVAAMEDILAVYAMEPDDEIPLVCMDEKPVQFLEDGYKIIPMKPGSPQKNDFEYERNGTGCIFMFVAPHLGFRYVDVTERRTKADWAHHIDYLVNGIFPNKKKIRLVNDNLNTHTIGALYETFPAAKARAIAERLILHYTPKHGSWLNIAEIELSALTRQCLNRRIGDIETMRFETSAWERDRNENQKTVEWHFKIDDARGKLESLYPKI